MQNTRHLFRHAARSLRTPIVALVLLLSAVAALAAPITKRFSFTASGFPPGSPVATVQGSFTVTWDPIVPVTNQSTGLTQHSLNLPYDGTLVFTSVKDSLVIGAGVDGAGIVHSDTNDFFVFISGATTATPTFAVVYEQVGLPGWIPQSSVTALVPPPTVTGVNPARDTTAGGTSVTISGTDFTGATAVTFGGTPAAFTVDSATQITAIAPPHAGGAVDAVVSTFAGDGTGTAALTYLKVPIVVTTTSDTTAAGQTTLRDAITLANSLPGADTINFSPSVTGTIQLTAALPDLSSDLTITGPGANVLAVRGEGASNRYRIFTIAAGATVDISGLTITNGDTADGVDDGSPRSGSNGGGIFNAGTLHLARVAVSGNQTGKGGDSSPGPGGFGGVGGRGGGIANEPGATLTITDSTISGNRTGHGGDADSPGPGGDGAGLANAGGTATITHSTLSGNTTGAGGTTGSGGSGGGIANTFSGTLTLTGSTLTANATGGAGGRGGGLVTQGGGSTTLRNTIIAGNSAFVSPDVSFHVNSAGYNLIGQTDGSTGFGATGDQTGTSAAPLDPRLAPLADNGGPTQTHALLFRSPAIDLGKNFAVDALGQPVLTDQTGLARTVELADALYPNAAGGDGTDIGAYEAQVEPAPEILISGNGMEIVNGDTTPRAADGTDFGNATLATTIGGSLFTITNTGTAALHYTGTPAVTFSGADAAAFSVQSQPTLPLRPHESRVVQLLFHPTGLGLHTATVTVLSDDVDEGTYTFTVAGTGILPPTVADNPTIGDLTPTSVTLGGNVTTDNFAAVTERGVVFAQTSLNPDPDLGEPNVTKVTAAGTTGVFTVPVAGLLPKTSYSFKAYAINSAGRAYSSTVTFTTYTFGADDAVATTTHGVTRIYPLANDVSPSGRPLGLLSVSNPAIVIDGRSLLIPAGFTGTFTYTFTDGTTVGQATVNVTAGTPVLNARTFSGLLLDPHGAISGAVDATFTATGRIATVRMTVGTRVVRFLVYFPAGSMTGSRFLGFGELTLTRNADGTVSASFASAGDLLGGVLQPRQAPAAPGRYNAALASIDAAIPGGGYLFVNTLSTSGAFLIGRLPDGTIFSASTSVHDDGTIAFDAIVRRGANPPELVGGELVFADLTATDLTGEVAWAKPIQKPGVAGLHLGGVNTILTVNGCQFKQQPLPAGNGNLTLSGGNLAVDEDTAVTITAGRPTTPTGSLRSWVTYPKVGIFLARVKVPGLPLPVLGEGVYLPKSNMAWGFFPGTDIGGRIELSAR